MQRSDELCSEQLKDHWLFEEQIARWKLDKLSDTEEEKIGRLQKRWSKMKEGNEEHLEFAHRRPFTRPYFD